MLLRGRETGREEEGQSATCTLRRGYGPFPPALLLLLLLLLLLRPGHRQPAAEGEFLRGSSSGGCAPWLFPPPGRAGRWMRPVAAESPGRPRPPQPPLQSAPRLASPPPAGGGRCVVRGGRRRGKAGAEAAAGRGRGAVAGGGRHVAPRRCGEGSGTRPAAPGGAARGRGRGGGARWLPSSSSSSSPNFPAFG
ncbi:unnamed protein product, partial [Bubo scandiacus]